MSDYRRLDLLTAGDGNKVAIRGRCRVIHSEYEWDEDTQDLTTVGPTYVSREMVNPTFNDIWQKAKYALRRTKSSGIFLESIEVHRDGPVKTVSLSFGT